MIFYRTFDTTNEFMKSSWASLGSSHPTIQHVKAAVWNSFCEMLIDEPGHMRIRDTARECTYDIIESRIITTEQAEAAENYKSVVIDVPDWLLDEHAKDQNQSG